ncbi:hypothetical protein [Dongia sp.]|uniref:hypothetical protein n=1 Tax=Dongia sp. TaxID=1977262 RepID=UPI00374FE6C2
MKYTTEAIEQPRNNIVQTEQRIVRQRRRVEKMLVERHPADEAQAQLLIMEQSLIAMTRFLKNLERDLEAGDLSLHRYKTAKRMKAAQPQAAADGADGQAPKSSESLDRTR